MYYLGVDGGGTRTTAVVADGNGNVLAKADGKSINYNSVGLIRAKENMREIILWLLDACGIKKFHTAFIGMSAISTRAGMAETKAFAACIMSSSIVDRLPYFHAYDPSIFVNASAMQSASDCSPAFSYVR